LEESQSGEGSPHSKRSALPEQAAENRFNCGVNDKLMVFE